MGNRITAARELAAHPRLLALVASAAISPWAARSVVMEVTDLTDEQSAAVVEDVCSKITSRQSSGRRSWTSAEVGRAARMTRRRRCPDTDRETRERAFHRRRVQVLPDKNGMAFLVADLDEIHAHRIHRRLTAITRGLSDAAESRTHDQIRADVLVDLLLGAPLQGARAGGTQVTPTEERRIEEPSAYDHAHGHGPGRGQDQGPDERGSVTAGDRTPTEGIPTVDLPGRSMSLPEIQVVVSWETLLGISSEPGLITGLGPIGVEVARELAADGRWRAWITDSSGAVIATGSSTYTPSPRVARLVRAREPYCRMPGCRRPAETCDLDHTVAYPQGTTSVGNLGPLCRRHHNLKTHLGWQLEPLQPQRASGHALPDPPPGWRWRTPAGIKITEQTAPPLE